MAINWTTIELPFGGGINTKSDPKLVKPPFAVDLQNIVFTEAPGYAKRLGTNTLIREIVNSANTLSSAVALVKRQNELCLVDDQRLYTYAENEGRWSQRDKIVAPKVSYQALSEREPNQTQADTAVSDNVLVTCWLDGSDNLVHYDVTDETTGAIYTANGSIANSTKPKLAVTDTAIFIVYINSSSGALRSTKISTKDPTNSSDSELKTDANSDAIFDVCPDWLDSTLSIIVYKRNADIAGFTLSSDGTASSSSALTTSATLIDVTALSVDTNSAYLFIAGYDAGPTAFVWCDVWNRDFASAAIGSPVSVTPGGTVVNVAVAASSGTAAGEYNVWYEESDANSYNHSVFYTGLIRLASPSLNSSIAR